MLPGFRFLFAAVTLAVSLLVFGLGAAALLRAAHEQFANTQTMRPPVALLAPLEPATATLSMLRVEPQAKPAAAPMANDKPLQEAKPAQETPTSTDTAASTPPTATPATDEAPPSAPASADNAPAAAETKPVETKAAENNAAEKPADTKPAEAVAETKPLDNVPAPPTLAAEVAAPPVQAAIQAVAPAAPAAAPDASQVAPTGSPAAPAIAAVAPAASSSDQASSPPPIVVAEAPSTSAPEAASAAEPSKIDVKAPEPIAAGENSTATAEPGPMAVAALTGPIPMPKRDPRPAKLVQPASASDGKETNKRDGDKPAHTDALSTKSPHKEAAKPKVRKRAEVRRSKPRRRVARQGSERAQPSFQQPNNPFGFPQ